MVVRTTLFLYPTVDPLMAPLTFRDPDFQITFPTSGAEVQNGQPFPITWTKGVYDGIDIFDLEFTRMSTDGLILAARSSASFEWP
jgi:hypothetical protein